ncbi:hypothetical protein BU23DRAFT_554892 [Bimuria novae-zelandiae CBS 107.79]|uniref:Uncharacterized protein n=1 Tax=Bimuria novae-zelandiae CBS 107.79 TaxID=1447943 RepID=A0A6A5V9J5_9PLEO|nr:hypothetical protein BU23DRAFT_554892 [Bimuria novae-zelandiae CBS 107.79]
MVYFNTTDADIKSAHTTSRRKRALHATATGFSLALTPVAPFMAIPSAIGAYKTHKHHKAKRLLEAQHPELTQPSNNDKFNANVRHVTRHFSRGSIGLVSASVLSPMLPHMVLPAGINVYILHKAEKDRKQLAAQMVGRGFRVRKRDVARGLTRVMIEKAIIIPITLGHDDLLLAFPTAAFSDGGMLHESLLRVDGIQEFNEAVNAPVEQLQEVLGIQTAEERLEAVQNYNADTGGWHEDAGMVASNVVIAGSAAAAVEWVVDRPLEYRDGKLQEILPSEKHGPGVRVAEVKG